MAAEKQFENKVKRWLESQGVYAIGTAEDKMNVPPCGYYEKRWGGGYAKTGLPDLHIVVNAINIDVELKAPNGRPSEVQKQKIVQINKSGSVGIILKPDGFEHFKKIVEGVISCRCHIQELNALKDVHSDIKCDILTKY